MGWACIGTGAVVESTTTSITLAEPAGVMANDWLFACFSSRTTATTAIVGSGWTTMVSQNNNNVVSNATTSVGSATMIVQLRGASAPTLTFTIPAGNNVTYGRIVAYRGGLTTGALDTTAQATTATNITAVSVAGMTTTVANDLIVAVIGSGRNSTMSAFNTTTPNGASGATVASGTVSSTAWTERADSGSNTTPRGALGIFDVVKATAGATGNLTATMATAGGHAVLAAAFKMAPVTGVKVWSGTAGVEKPVKVWSGSAWVAKQAKFWTGTTWKNVGLGTWGGGGGGGVTVDSFVAGYANASAGTVTYGGITFTAGLAVINVMTAGDTTTDLISVTINSVPATKILDVHWGGVYCATVSAGTGTITFGISGSILYTAMSMAIVHGANATPYASSIYTASNPDPSQYTPIDIPANGVGLAFYGNYSAPNAPPYTWTGCDSTGGDAGSRNPITGPTSVVNHKTGTGSIISGWTASTTGWGGGYSFNHLVSFGP